MQKQFCWRNSIIDLLIITLSIFNIIIGILSVIKSNLFDLILIAIFFYLIFVKGLSKEWGALHYFTKQGFSLIILLIFILLIIYKITNILIIAMIIKPLLIGLISSTIFIPIVIDLFLRNISKNESIGIKEAVVLYRNFIFNIFQDFFTGFRFVSWRSNRKLINKFYYIYLITINLTSRISIISSQLLSAVYIRNFNVGDTIYLKFKYKNYLILVLLNLILYFLVLIKIFKWIKW